MSLITLTRVIDDGDGDPMDVTYAWIEDDPPNVVEERLRARHRATRHRTHADLHRPGDRVCRVRDVGGV